MRPNQPRATSQCLTAAAKGLFLLTVSCVWLSGAASAATMGTGAFYLEVQGDPLNNTHCFLIDPYVDQSYDVFGVPVDLATSVGRTVCIGTVVGGFAQGQGTHCQSYPDGSVFSFDIVSSGLLCTDPAPCGPFNSYSLVSRSIINAAGSLPSALGAGLAYAFDTHFSPLPQGPATIPGCPLVGSAFRFSGSASQSAFQVQTTPTGSNQTVSFPATSYLNPITGETVPSDISMTFADVTAAGTTTVTASSNAAAVVGANFASSINGYQATFLEVTTTAAVTPPITICTSYADADDDGFLDGSSPPVPESALSFLHGEGDPVTFVDRTSSRDADNNVICAQVSSLSPFAVLVQANGDCVAPNDPCDDGDLCTIDDTCNASLECVGGGPATCADDGNPCTSSVCVSPGGCQNVPSPATGCNTSNDKSLLLIQNDGNDAKDQVLFKWLKGTSPLAELGDPTVASSYTLCAFDANKMLVSASAPAATMCGTKPCWAFTGPASVPNGVKYADPLASASGVKVVKAKADTTGKASLLYKAKGTNITPIDVGGIAYPVTVQVRTNDAGCWEQQFTAADEKKNDGTKFKAVHVGP